MQQILLPLKRFRIPARHIEWLRLANSADYGEKKFWFYGFKTNFLRAHAITDGLDLQVITDRCWCGDGIFRGRDHDAPERYWQVCYRCNGTGVYRERRVVLIRWNLGLYIFHEPSNLIQYSEGAEYRVMIVGYVKHEGFSQAEGWRAMIKLFLVYDRARLYRMIRCRLRDWWRWSVLYRLRWRINRFRERIFGADEIPF